MILSRSEGKFLKNLCVQLVKCMKIKCGKLSRENLLLSIQLYLLVCKRKIFKNSIYSSVFASLIKVKRDDDHITILVIVILFIVL